MLPSPLPPVGTTRSLRPLGSYWGKGDRNDNVDHTIWREGSAVTITCALRINDKTHVRELHTCKLGDREQKD